MKLAGAYINDETYGRLAVPEVCERVLDAEGRVRGRTWRRMPGGNGTTKVLNWWLWKRGLLDLEEERAQADALADMGPEF